MCKLCIRCSLPYTGKLFERVRVGFMKTIEDMAQQKEGETWTYPVLTHGREISEEDRRWMKKSQDSGGVGTFSEYILIEEEKP